MTRGDVWFLLGFPGAGKSTMLKGLSRRRPDVATVDLDAEIERRTGLSVTELFATRGEDAFRRLESETLRSLVDRRRGPLVVACGGGTPCFAGNMDYMNEAGTTVMLDVDPTILFQRLSRGRHKRPLLANLDDDALRAYIERVMADRSVHYDKAASRFNATLLQSEQEIESTVDRFITRYGL